MGGLDRNRCLLGCGAHIQSFRHQTTFACSFYLGDEAEHLDGADLSEAVSAVHRPVGMRWVRKSVGDVVGVFKVNGLDRDKEHQNSTTTGNKNALQIVCGVPIRVETDDLCVCSCLCVVVWWWWVSSPTPSTPPEANQPPHPPYLAGHRQVKAQPARARGDEEERLALVAVEGCFGVGWFVCASVGQFMCKHERRVSPNRPTDQSPKRMQDKSTGSYFRWPPAARCP